MEVAIIGAGIAGLGAAYMLIKAGYKKITIYEAQDYVGGRIKSYKFDDGYLELGAQWIHGQENNILFDMAAQRDLIAPIESFEGVGHFCTQDGLAIDPSLVNQVIMFLDSIKISLSNGDYKLDHGNCNKNGSDCSGDTSVADVFRNSFKKWLNGKKCKSPNDAQLFQGIFNWFMKFETIDNSCSSLDQLSVISYSLYRECEGALLNNFKSGYSSIIDSLLDDCSEIQILTNSPVKTIDYGSLSNKVKLVLENGKTVTASHVIVTNSIGFLKDNLGSFFKPSLPLDKRLVIQTMGFGTVNKIYLIFDKPFWSKTDLGFQLVWLINNQVNKYPSWAQDISGIDSVNGQPNVLVGWIGGQGAELIEAEDDDTLIDVFHNLMKDFLASVVTQEITKPIKLIRTKWSSNPYVRGAYSHRTIAYAKTNLSLDQFNSPLTAQHSTDSGQSIDWPLVLFAGEATDEKFFSTTHGALSSGFREAQRLIDFWVKNHL